MSKKLTKEELRHDPIAESIEKFFEDIVHFKPTDKQKKVGGIILAVLILLGVYYYSTRPRYNAQAQLMLIQAQSVLYQVNPRDTTSSQVESLLKNIITQYNGTVSAKRALYYLGLYYFKMNQLDKAEQYFNNFLAHGVKDPLLVSSALAHLGSIYIAKGKTEKGYASLVEASRKAPLKTLKAFYLYRAAKLRESQRDYNDAYVLLKKIKDEFPEFSVQRRGDIDRELEVLKTLMEGNKG